jgi:outer membrane protein TolC
VFVLLLPAALHAGDRRGIEVGSISELDLEAVRSIIDQSDDVGMPVVAERRALSLEEGVKTALELNLDLQIVALDVDASEVDIKGARSKFHPVAGVSGSADGSKRAEDFPKRDQDWNNQDVTAFVDQELPTGGSATLGVGYGRSFSNEFVVPTDLNAPPTSLVTQNQIAGLGIEVRQPLLKGGRIFVARREILNAEYDNEIARADLRGQILRVTAETKAAYYQVVRAIRQIEVIEQAIVRDESLVRASTALFDAGRVSKVDVYSADIRLSNDRARLATSNADLELTQNKLRQVIGLPIDTQVDVTDLTVPFYPIQIELEEWIRRAHDERPELVRLRTQLDKADLAIRVGKNAKLPTLDISGGFQPGFDWKSYNWNAGLGFGYQIGNTAAKSRLKASGIQRDQIRREFVRQRRLIDLEVREVEIRLRQNIERLKSLTVQVEKARSKGEIARGRFEMGLADNQDITNADEELIRSESALLEALVEYATNIAELEARIGGSI